MKSSHAVIKVALLAILIDVGLTRMVSEAERREMDEDAKKDMKKKFLQMCEAYPGPEDDPKMKLRQRAMLWVGDEDYTSEVKKEVEKPVKVNEHFDGPHFSFAFFVSDEDRENIKKPKYDPELFSAHTEMAVLKKGEDIIKTQFKDKEQKPNLYLYTRNSPCCTANEKKNGNVIQQFKECISGCSKEIPDWVIKNKETFNTLYIAWEFPYDPQSHDRPVDQEYLFGLEKMFNTPDITVFFTETDAETKRFCAKMTAFKWLQKEMHTCLKGKMDTTDVNKKCNDNDLAKLVNRITWHCGIRRLGKASMKYFRNAAAEPNCWFNTIGSQSIIAEKDGNKVKTQFFQTAARSCLSSKNLEGKVKVGLPLSPSDPTKYSTDASVLNNLDSGLCSS
eukprot:Seg1037.2 transcript_id=Seg1037.2/GoldUCD/mRNA.D3Y31 product="hypothetical protein" protein_id=Seg1037.2/GoldUCD/D3Y31